MSNNDPRESVMMALRDLDRLNPPLRDIAFRAISEHAQRLSAAASGAGPTSMHPGAIPTTTSKFECPSCGYKGNATYA